MKSHILSIILLIGALSFAQNNRNSDFESYFSIKLGVNSVDSSGQQDIFYTFSNSDEIAFTNPYALGVDYRFSRLLSVGLFGSINKWEPGDSIDGVIINEDVNYSSIDLNAKVYIDELIFRKKENYRRDWLDIYISLGGGYFSEIESGLSGNAGLGGNLWITDNLGINIEGVGKFSEEELTTSSHFQYFAGLTYRFGSKKKTVEEDPTEEEEEITPEEETPEAVTPPVEENKDSDNDGVIDEYDDCPNIAGSSDNKGCPKVVVEEKPTINEDEIRKDILLLSKQVLFDIDSSELRSDAIVNLDKIIDYLKLMPNSNLFISGHTDSTGSVTHNSNLSLDRANSVKQYILDSGVPVGNITTEGLEKSDPVASNLSKEGRQKNRRVEIYLNN